MNEMIQFVGLGGTPLVRAMVKATKIQNGIVLVLLSLIFGVILNIALAMVLGNDIRIAVAIGIVTAFLSNVYNDIKEVFTYFKKVTAFGL